MLTGIININGNSLRDLELAIDEAKRLISKGMTNGADSNEDGNFDFEITGEEE